jgi:RNA polymerase sigma factor (sigma-70 family)
MSDLDTLQLYAKTRDAGAFASLMAAYADMVYATCLRILANHADAQDATQECFWRLARESASIRTHVGAWLHRCATNECITRKRRKAAKVQRELTYETTRRAQRADAGWSEIAPAVDQALEELPDDLRGLLIAHFLQRRTQAELAAEHNLSPATMSRRIAEGVDLIRKKLKTTGVVTAVTALTYLLADRTAAAAPPALVSNLGRMAIVGPSPLPPSWIVKAKIATTLTVAAGAAIVAWIILSRHAHAPITTIPVPLPPTPRQVFPDSYTDRAAAVPPNAYAALYRIRNTLPQYQPTEAIAAVRELVQTGPIATPAICAELDRSAREPHQRLLLLTLRLLHDRAAVPALLRILPHLSPTESPYPLALNDDALATFLRKHPAPRLPQTDAFLLQPALTECNAALRQLTAHDEPSPAAWQTWYLTQTLLPRLPLDVSIPVDDLVATRGLAAAGPLFPTGPSINLSELHELTLSPDDAPYLDLDTDMTFTAPSPDADLAVVRHRDRTVTLEGLTLSAWSISSARFDTLPAEIHLNPTLDTGPDGPLPLSATPGATPQTFLFTTLTHTRGILQLCPPGARHSQILHLRYRVYAP